MHYLYFLFLLCIRSLQGICFHGISPMENSRNMSCKFYRCVTIIETPSYQANMERILNIVEANVYKDSRQHVILYKTNGSHKDALPISTLLQFSLVSLSLFFSLYLSTVSTCILYIPMYINLYLSCFLDLSLYIYLSLFISISLSCTMYFIFLS